MDSVKVRLRNPETTDAAGRFADPSDLLAWSDVPYRLPEQCEHNETMCRDCRHQWEWDYEVQTSGTTESDSPTMASDPDDNSLASATEPSNDPAPSARCHHDARCP
jgi:hypothetical protein